MSAMKGNSIRLRGPVFFLCAVLILLSLAGCEQIFTYSPLTFAQRPVSSLTPEQQLAFGENALASGNTQLMVDALAALQNTNTPDAQYLASQLGVELSGVPDVLTGVLDGTITVPTELTPTTVEDFIHQNDLQPQYLIDASANLLNAQALDHPLEPTDYVMGGLGLALGAATQQPDGTYDFTNANLAPAEAFIAEGLASLGDVPPSDPNYQLLSNMQTLLGTL